MTAILYIQLKDHDDTKHGIDKRFLLFKKYKNEAGALVAAKYYLTTYDWMANKIRIDESSHSSYFEI